MRVTVRLFARLAGDRRRGGAAATVEPGATVGSRLA